MGLSVVVSGAIVLFSMFFVISAFPVIAENAFSVSQGSTKIYDIENQIIHTDIDILSVTGSGGSGNISVELNNSGNRKLWDYDGFDFIVTYDANMAGDSVRTTEYLEFTDSCPVTNGQWCVQDISPDDVDPLIINSDETATFDAELTNNVYPGGLIIVTIATSNGVNTTSSETV